MAYAASAQLHSIDTVAPSLMQPSMGLGSRTPMQLVHISNMKMNAQIYSPRSLSIQRRILIKNFLTVLYQMHPIEWIEDSPVDDKDQWLEQTLTAAGIDQESDSAQNDQQNGYGYQDQGNYGYSSTSSSEQYNLNGSSGGNRNNSHDDGLGLQDDPLMPAVTAAATAVTLRRRPSSRSSRMPLPRPISTELPSALQSYLSTVFDVDWSVGLAHQKRPTPSRPSSSRPTSITAADLLVLENAPSLADTLSLPNLLPSKTIPSRVETTSHLDIPRRQDAPALQDSLPPQGASLQKGLLPQQSTAYDTQHSQPEEPSSTHIHNHIHIHIHNYSQESSSKGYDNSSSASANMSSSEKSHPPPVTRSSRYPKPQQETVVALSEPPHQHPYQQAPTHASHDQTLMPEKDLHSYISNFPAPPTQQVMYTAPISIAAAGPLAIPSSTLPTSTGSFGTYPPEKTPDFMPSSEEEQPYIATAPPVVARHARSPPPPPYTQSPDDTPASEYGALTYPRPMAQVPPPSQSRTFVMPTLTIKPQVPLMSSVASLSSNSSDSGSSSYRGSYGGYSNHNNQKLIEYQQYQERQKVYLREEEAKDGSRSGADGLGFIKQLFKQSSKKKRTVSVISAPLPFTTSTLLLSSYNPNLIQDLTKKDPTKPLPSLPPVASVRPTSERIS
ncbi:hypothetical protein BGZ99_010314 [Dissophora globulifera]|uniref:Uncharacterized protein n=1 Tax=Dissophora globulifera TaxID=979702 RepID=A0A9P6R6L4_9FUNG|nr:hypothetical protein BGZ99_010314 [Dissophora globulifera]